MRNGEREAGREVEDALAILDGTVGQVIRHGNGPAARLRTRKAGQRTRYHRADIEQLARQYGAEATPLLPAPAWMVAIGVLLNRYERQQHELAAARQEFGQLRGIRHGQQPMSGGDHAVQACFRA